MSDVEQDQDAAAKASFRFPKDDAPKEMAESRGDRQERIMKEKYIDTIEDEAMRGRMQMYMRGLVETFHKYKDKPNDNIMWEFVHGTEDGRLAKLTMGDFLSEERLGDMIDTLREERKY